MKGILYEGEDFISDLHPMNPRPTIGVRWIDKIWYKIRKGLID